MPPTHHLPADNPGFLDTLTWDHERARTLALQALRDGRFRRLAQALSSDSGGAKASLERIVRQASRPPVTLFPGSAQVLPGELWLLGELPDGEQLLLAVSAGQIPPQRGGGLRPLCSLRFEGSGVAGEAAAFPMDLVHLRAFLRRVAPQVAPVPPSRPGLGIGCRMGVLDLPVALRTVSRFDLCASVIQSSVYRELAPLEELAGFPPPEIELPGVGKVPLGHTGQSITGQFLAMMAARLKLGDRTPIAADADHLPLRGMSPEGRRLARRLVREASDRTLYTLDPHFCLYGGDAILGEALFQGRQPELETAFRRRFSAGEQRELLTRFAGRRFRVPDPAGGRGHEISFGRAEVQDAALRFQEPLRAIEEACAEIRQVKVGAPFVVEVSIDEVPGLSEPFHFYYLASELRRRSIPLFSLAPGLGFSKLDVDVRDARGAFERRVRVLAGVAAHFGVVMGIHSGDGKSVRTRRLLSRATGGNFWYKISPDRQRNFFAALFRCPRGSEGRRLFDQIYRLTLARVIRLALSAGGETERVARQTLGTVAGGRGLSRAVATQLMGALGGEERGRPARIRCLLTDVHAASPRQIPGDLEDGITHDYAFTAVGERDARGRFLNRGRFFRLSPEALRIYHRLDARYLTDLIRSLGLDGGGTGGGA